LQSEASATTSDQQLQVELQAEATTALKTDVQISNDTSKTLDLTSSATIPPQIENSHLASEIKSETKTTAPFTAMGTASTATVKQNSNVTAETKSTAVNEKFTQNSSLATAIDTTAGKPQPATSQPPPDMEIANALQNATNITGFLFSPK
jgi:hypothetical protein